MPSQAQPRLPTPLPSPALVSFSPPHPCPPSSWVILAEYKHADPTRLLETAPLITPSSGCPSPAGPPGGGDCWAALLTPRQH